MELRQETLPSLGPEFDEPTGYGLYLIDDYTPWLDFIRNKINEYKEDSIVFYDMSFKLTYIPIRSDYLILRAGVEQNPDYNIIDIVFSCVDDLMSYLQDNIEDTRVNALKYQRKLFHERLEKIKQLKGETSL